MTEELGLTGKGVAPVQIEGLDKLVMKYVAKRDQKKRITKKLAEEEKEARAALMDAMHEHEKELVDPNTGDLIYRFDETVVSIVAGEEELLIEHKEAQ